MGLSTPYVRDSVAQAALLDNYHESLMASVGDPGIAHLKDIVAHRDRVFSELPPRTLETFRALSQKVTANRKDERDVALERWVSGAPLTKDMLRYIDMLGAFTAAAEALLSPHKRVVNLSFKEFSENLPGDGIDGAGAYGLRGLLLPAEVVVIDDDVSQAQLDAMTRSLEKLGFPTAQLIRYSEFIQNRHELAGYRVDEWIRDSKTLEVNARLWQRQWNNKIFQQLAYAGIPGVPQMLVAGRAGALAAIEQRDSTLNDGTRKFLKIAEDSAGGDGVKSVFNARDVAREAARLDPELPVMVQAPAIDPRVLAGEPFNEGSLNYVDTWRGPWKVMASTQRVKEHSHVGNDWPGALPESAHDMADACAIRRYRARKVTPRPPERENGLYYGYDIAFKQDRAGFVEHNERNTGPSPSLIGGVVAGFTNGRTDKHFFPTLTAMEAALDVCNRDRTRSLTLPSVAAELGDGSIKAEFGHYAIDESESPLGRAGEASIRVSLDESGTTKGRG